MLFFSINRSEKSKTALTDKQRWESVT